MSAAAATSDDRRATAPGPWLVAAVGVLSAAGIAYELLLTRLLSIVLWHHFATMIISLALLGIAAGGTFIALARRVLEARFTVVFAACAAGMAVSAPAGFALAQRAAFNPLELIWDPLQQLRLLGVALLLVLPFFCSGTAIGLTLVRFGGAVGRLYRADLAGAGVGAAAIVGALFLLRPEEALRGVGALGLLAAAGALLEGRRQRWALAAAILAPALALAWPGDWLRPIPSPYKGLSLALTVPDTKVVAEGSSPLGLISVVDSPGMPFRFAPGLSLGTSAEPPPQLGLFTDADAMTAITRFDGDWPALAYLDQQTAAAPYHLLDRPRVLVLGAGGGADVLRALYYGAAHVDAVELDPQVVELLREDFAAYAGDIYRRADVAVRTAEARAFVAGSDARWDLIHLGPLDSFSASGGGLLAAGESPILTVEALQDYVAHLSPGGIVSITLWVQAPPRAVLKLFATAAVALEAMGVAAPGRHLILLRGWSTATLLVGASPFDADAIARIHAFGEARSFDIDWHDGVLADQTNRFNRLAAPTPFDAAVAMLGQDRQAFIDGYRFNIVPATDDRPFFNRFLKWSSVPELLWLRGQGGLTLLDAGYVVIVVALVQAALASLVLVLLPLAFLPRRNGAPRSGIAGWRIAAYFAALGFAFIFLEISFMQRLTLLLGHPVTATAVVLGGFLVAAGLGSGASRRLMLVRPRSGLPLAVGCLCGLAIAYVLLLPWVVGGAMTLPFAARLAVALAIIGPLAFLMGFPFPAGLEAVLRHAPGLAPWAWAVNGCASVIGAILAGLLAMHWGLNAVALLAVALYLAAAAVLRAPRNLAAS